MPPREGQMANFGKSLNKLLAVSILGACASVSRETLPEFPTRPVVQEFMIDGDKGLMLGVLPQDDIPLAHCRLNAHGAKTCYGYLDVGAQAIKEYIAELEIRLRECRK